MSAQLERGGVLTPDQRELLTAVQNQLIPPEGDLPGAGDAGGAGVVAGYLVSRPALRRPLLEALRAIEVAAGADGFRELDAFAQVEVLRAVESERPEAFAELVRQTYNAYYTNPTVQIAAGYTPGTPQPEGFELPPFDSALLDRVKQRGKLWREA